MIKANSGGGLSTIYSNKIKKKKKPRVLKKIKLHNKIQKSNNDVMISLFTLPFFKRSIPKFCHQDVFFWLLHDPGFLQK